MSTAVRQPRIATEARGSRQRGRTRRGLMSRVSRLLRPTGRCRTFGEAVRTFLEYLKTNRRCSPYTLSTYRSHYQGFDGFLATERRSSALADIGATEIEAFVQSLTGLAAATVQLKLNALSSLFSYFVRRGVLTRNPVDEVDRPRRPRQPPRAIPKRDLEQLLGQPMNARERAFLLTLLLTGIRRSELIGLDCGDIDWDAKAITVRGKGDKARRVPVPDGLCPILRDYVGERANRPEGPVFLSEAGERMRPSSFQRLRKRLFRQAGLGGRGYRAHDLRHTFATLALPATDIRTLQELMGHEDLATTARYLSSDMRRKREAVNSLPVTIGFPQGQGVDGSAQGGEVAMQVDRSGFEGSVPEQFLQGPQVAATAKHQSGEGMAQAMKSEARAVNASAGQSTAEQGLESMSAKGSPHVVY